VYEWKAWDAFLLGYVLPDAVVLHGNLFEEPSDVLSQVPADTTHFFFQVNVSLKANAPTARSSVCEALSERGIKVVNQRMLNLTKRHLQLELQRIGLPNVLAERNGSPSERLIVKTNENAGAEFERTLDEATLRALQLSLPSDSIQSARDYAVLTRECLQEEWWLDPGLTIERYVENPDGRFLRVYIAGELVIIVFAYSIALIKKIEGDSRDRNIVTTREDLKHSWEYIPRRLADVLSKWLKNASCDYCAVDIVTDGHEYFIIDVNDTPWVGRRIPDQDFLDLFRAAFEDMRS
jgi:hypothetical protein